MEHVEKQGTVDVKIRTMWLVKDNALMITQSWTKSTGEEESTLMVLGESAARELAKEIKRIFPDKRFEGG